MAVPNHFSEAQKARLRYLLEDEWVALDAEKEGGEDTSATQANLLKALSEVESAAELHYFSRHFNWDTGTETLESLLEHPLIERATLLMIYWMAGPGYYMKFASESEMQSHELESLTFIRRVETALRHNWKQSGSVRFDPRNDEGYDWTTRYRIPMSKPTERNFEPVYSIPDNLFASAP